MGLPYDHEEMTKIYQPFRNDLQTSFPSMSQSSTPSITPAPTYEA